MTFLSLFLGSLSTAYAVPVQLSQQGRLLDSSGAAVTGLHTLTFRLYDAQFGGNVVWEDNQQVGFVDGYYATLVGNNLNNPLDDSALATSPLYLELEVDGGGPVGGRQPVVSAPYARLSNTASNLSGGTVDASSVSVNGQLVIDAAGSWVGPALAVNWGDLINIPSDLADGDDDTLSGLSCNIGQIAGWDGGTWVCVDDNGLTEAEVEAYVTNDAIDLHTNSTLGGLPILTQGDGETLSGLSCQNGDVAKYDSVLGWQCDVDNDSSAADWALLSGVPADIADGDDDTWLSEAQVEGFVTNDALDLATGTTLSGDAILASSGCQVGEFLSYDGQDWVCTNLLSLFDQDGDGIYGWLDCDDTDPLSEIKANDADCDGTVTALDCDDNDAGSTVLSEDADCDGVLTAEDCDDTDAMSTVLAQDGDCDGVLTADDCNDADSGSTTLAEDGDCDGSMTADDCDDTDPASTILANDADCDGSTTAQDCDDTDPNTVGGMGTASSCPLDSCQDILSGGFSTGDGQYWVLAGGSPLEVYCDMTQEGGGWTLVGRIPPTGNWFAYNTSDPDMGYANTYGVYEPNPNSGSHFLHRRDQLGHNGEIMFAYGDWSYWVRGLESEWFSGTYANSCRDFQASSVHPNGGCYYWYNRGSANQEDPWIGVGDHDNFLVWGENHPGSTTSISYKNAHGGVTVWVR